MWLCMYTHLLMHMSWHLPVGSWFSSTIWVEGLDASSFYPLIHLSIPYLIYRSNELGNFSLPFSFAMYMLAHHGLETIRTVYHKWKCIEPWAKASFPSYVSISQAFYHIKQNHNVTQWINSYIIICHHSVCNSLITRFVILLWVWQII